MGGATNKTGKVRSKTELGRVGGLKEKASQGWNVRAL